MAAISQPADQEVGDLRQAMKGDGQIHAAADSTAELNPGHDGNSSECSGEAPGDNNDAPRANGVHEGAIDPAMYYAANGYGPHTYVYEYPQGAGYEPPAAEWDEYTRYVDGCEVQSPVFSENGSAVYVHGYGYPSQPGYSYAPGAIPTIGADGQLYGPQPYQYPGHIYPQSVAPGGQYVQSSPVISGELPGGGGEPGPPGVDGSNPALANGNGGPMGHRPGYPLAMMQPHAPYRGVLPMTMHNTGHQDVRVFDNTRGGNNSWADMTKTAEGQQRPGNPTQGHVGTSQAVSPPVQATGQTGRPNSAVQVNMQASQQPQRAPTSLASSSLGPGALARGYPPLGRPSSAAPNGTGRAGRGQGSNGLETRSIGRGWPGTEKSGKPRGRGTGLVGNGNGNLDILNEQNRGPRTTRARSQRTAPAVLRHTRGQGGSANGNCDALSFLANREQYNRPDFPTKYEHARFFVIKSYSEDDVHKSIKYNVWASTPNGNKRLELAYQEAQTRHGGKPGGCPVFFFFSVNASGQFCGVAEMAGSVDFNKSVDFWQQDKWNGRFSVKWHIIKDIPNCQFRHIILENNDNKPVTNSRDTQEVKFDQGLEMLNIFKSYTSKTSILDDFQFYENRQRAMQEKRTRQQAQQQRERQQGGLQLPGDTGQGVLDDSTGKFNKIEKSPDLAEENGCAKPRILGKGEINSRHPPPPPGDNTELPTQRLGQLRLSDARDDSSSSDDKKIGDVKPATCEREAVLVLNTALSNDKVGLVKQEQ